MIEKNSAGWSDSDREGLGAIEESSQRPHLRSYIQSRLSKASPIKYWSDFDGVAQPNRLVRHLLGTATLALVFGEPSGGKTFWVTDLALHIATGKEWNDRSVTAGAVMYVACEGFAGLTNRLAAFRQIWCPPSYTPFTVFAASINLGPEGHDADVIIDAAAEIQQKTGQDVQLIVVDTLARSMGGGDENSAKDMGIFIEACDRIRVGTGATVLIIHHSGKSRQSGARGSSALLAAVDTAIEVTKCANSNIRTAKVVKQKDGADGVTFDFALRLVEIGRDDEDEAITTCFVDPCEQGAKLKKSQSLTALETKALDVLRKMISTEGKSAPAQAKISEGKVVPTKEFQVRLKRSKTISDEKSPSARKQWQRLKDGLCRKEAIAIQGDYCWPRSSNGK